MVYFAVSVLVLAALLFLPVSRMIWVLSVRRLQRKLNVELGDEDLRGQLARARFLAVLVSLLFSFLFNLNLMGIPGNG